MRLDVFTLADSSCHALTRVGSYIEGPSGTLYRVGEHATNSMCGGRHLEIAPVHPNASVMEWVRNKKPCPEPLSFSVPAGLWDKGIAVISISPTKEDLVCFEDKLKELLAANAGVLDVTVASTKVVPFNKDVPVLLALIHHNDMLHHEEGTGRCAYCDDDCLDDEGWCNYCEASTEQGGPCEDECHPGDRSAEDYTGGLRWEPCVFIRWDSGGATSIEWEETSHDEYSWGEVPFKVTLATIVDNMFVSESTGLNCWSFISSNVGDPSYSTPEVMYFLRKNESVLKEDYGLALLYPEGIATNPNEAYHWIDSMIVYVKDKAKFLGAVAQ